MNSRIPSNNSGNMTFFSNWPNSRRNNPKAIDHQIKKEKIISDNRKMAVLLGRIWIGDYM
jgi:hypothetical protein